jgi:hypothetical protein
MANIRGKDQTFVGFWCEDSFLEKIENSRGATPRSQYVRDAVAELLKTEGYIISEAEKSPPSRTGKGGPLRKSPLHKHSNSKPLSAEQQMAKKSAGQ